MARRLGQQINEMVITDSLSGSDITFYYRMPSITERVKYQSGLFSLRGGNRLQVKSFETRLSYGLEIITGFKEGDFEIEQDGKWVAISSQQDSPNYYAGWKAVLRKDAPDLVSALAAAVFESASASATVGEEGESSVEEPIERKNSQSSLSAITDLSA